MPRHALIAGAIVLVACGGAPAPKTARESVTVIVTGDEKIAPRARRALAQPADLPLDVRVAEAPNGAAPPPAHGDVDAALASARRDYVDGSFARCLSGLAGDALVPDLLGAGRRAVAARVLFWRTACRVGESAIADANAAARELAVLGLEAPPDVDAAAPEVEATIARALRAVSEAPRVPLSVSADAERAAVSIDGRADACVAPCVLEVPAGAHVVGIDADGVMPERRVVVVEAPRASVAFKTTGAPPDLAARQWAARYARSDALESAASMRLLARAARARRLALIDVEPGSDARLRGALAVDGAVASRGEQSGVDPETQAPRLLRELLVQGNVVEPAPRLVARPLFWVVVGVVAAGAAVTTYLILRPAPQRTEVGL